MNYVEWPDSFGANFYKNQALAMLNGRLNVPYHWYGDECTWIKGRCFGYFGIFPSILRLPLVFFWGNSAPALIPLSVALAAGVTIWSSLNILRLAMSDQIKPSFSSHERLGITSLYAILLGFAGPLTILSQAKVYREAIIWMVALQLLALYLGLRWISSRNPMWAWAALAAAIGATNSRPSAIAPMVLLGMWLYWHENRRQPLSSIKLASIPLLVITLPAATALLVLYIKFGAFGSPWESYTNASLLKDVYRLNNGQMRGLRFFGSNLVQYLRPDSIRYSFSYPWSRALVPDVKPAKLVSPIVKNGMWIGETVSVTNSFPVHLILTIAHGSQLALTGWKRNLNQLPTGSLAFAVTTSAGCAGALTFFASATRYTGDFSPLLVCGTIFGGLFVCSSLKSRGLLSTILLTMIPIALYLSLVLFSLNVNSFPDLG